MVVRPSGELVAIAGDAGELDTEALARRGLSELEAGDLHAALRRERGTLVHEPALYMNLRVDLMSRRVVTMVAFSSATSPGFVRLATKRMANALEPLLSSDPDFEPVPPDDLT